MIVSESILKYFESIEAGRGPPKPKKKPYFITRYYFSMKEIKMNQPTQTARQKQNFKALPQSFESTRGPPKIKKTPFFFVPKATDPLHFQLYYYPTANKFNRSRSTALRICRASSIPVGTLSASRTTNCSAPVSSRTTIAFFSEAVSPMTLLPGTKMS